MQLPVISPWFDMLHNRFVNSKIMGMKLNVHGLWITYPLLNLKEIGVQSTLVKPNHFNRISIFCAHNFYFLWYFSLNGGFEPISTSFNVTDKISLGYWGGWIVSFLLWKLVIHCSKGEPDSLAIDLWKTWNNLCVTFDFQT